MQNQRSLTETFKSVFAAFIGVQSDKNRREDFNQGKLSHFIFAGLIAAALFVLTLVLVVSMVMPS